MLPRNCSTDIIAAVQYADSILSDQGSQQANETKEAVIKALGLTESIDDLDDATMSSVLASEFEWFQVRQVF